MSKLLLGSVIFAAMALQGCANTTHTINVEPKTFVADQQYTNQHQIHYSVKPFSVNKIGNIKTGIGEKATIVVGNNVRSALEASLSSKLADYGFQSSRGALPATLFMIELSNLSYTTRTIALKTEATLVADIKATVVKGDQTYSANFKSEKIDQYGTLPDREVVEEEINQLLGKTIDRAFHDKKLIALLSY